MWLLIYTPDSLKKWSSFYVDFGWNNALENTIGAWDLLIPWWVDWGTAYPTEIQVNWLKNAQLESKPRVWYYSAWKYQPIYSWNKVTISELSTIDKKEERGEINSSFSVLLCIGV